MRKGAAADTFSIPAYTMEDSQFFNSPAVFVNVSSLSFFRIFVVVHNRRKGECEHVRNMEIETSSMV